MRVGETLDLSTDDGEDVALETRQDLNISSIGGSGSVDGSIGIDGQSWEGLEWEGRVGAGARSDKGSSDRVDLVKVERGVFGSGPCRVLENGRVDPTLVSSLGGEDGSGHSDVGGLSDGRGSTEVSRDTDVLDESSGSQERLGVDYTGELVGAGLGSGSSKSSREESNVLSLVLSDVLNSLSDLYVSHTRQHFSMETTDPFGVTGLGKVVGGELVQSPVVKVVLEVFKGQRILENVTGD